MESVDMTAQNIEKIGALFPNCITETKDENGRLKKAINFELLKQMLSEDLIDGDEAYEFTWVGKKAAIVEANKPIRKTLRPCKEESVNWDTTENLYIEGDNLEVLKLLQESYLGKVKLIYIDPPYNTGHDFVYRDNFHQSQSVYDEEIGKIDRDGNRLFQNTESNGRFHSDWCNMLYPRLLLSRNLLADNDPRGPWKADPFDAPNVRQNLTYKIVNPNTGEEFFPPAGRHWRTEEKNYRQLLADGRIVFGKTGNSKPQLKVFYDEKKMFGTVDTSWWTGEKCGTTTQGTKEQMKLFDGVAPFDTPKPVKMILQILQLVSLPNNNDIVLDFFSGSATTAHAVMQYNAEDGGNRKFIMVQLEETCSNESIARKAGFDTIPQIGKERIRRAAKKIHEEHPEAKFDDGFRVFKLADSNMNDVYYGADEYNQGMLSMLESNIKSDRTDLDLLFGCLLEWGLPLSLPYSSETIEGCTVHNYNDGDLIASFDENIPESVIKAIAKKQPLRAVFRDSSFANSPSKINVGEIFKMLAPDTRVKVI